MVIDIGGGTSETAVISLGGIVALEAVRVGSFDIDAAIQNYVRREHGIAIGERTAEEIKVAIGSADPTEDENQAEVRGRDLMTGSAEDGAADAGGDPLRDRGRRLVDHLVGHPLPRQGAARAVAGLPRARHVPRRRRRPAARPRRSGSSARPKVPVQAVERAARGRRARRRARASSTTRRSRACSWALAGSAVRAASRRRPGPRRRAAADPRAVPRARRVPARGRPRRPSRRPLRRPGRTTSTAPTVRS